MSPPTLPPCGDPATWLIAGVAATVLWPMQHRRRRWHGLRIHQQQATYSLSKAIYANEQVCIGWRRTGAYYTAKLTFSHDFPIKV